MAYRIFPKLRVDPVRRLLSALPYRLFTVICWTYVALVLGFAGAAIVISFVVGGFLAGFICSTLVAFPFGVVMAFRRVSRGSFLPHA
jgi:hypothetical protein